MTGGLADTTQPEPWFAEHDVTLWQGHVLDVLPTIEAESVNCVVTSPPYYGLRDYGTATWDGGENSCDHLRAMVPRGPDDPGIRRSTLDGGKGITTAQSETRSYTGICGKCGARRVDHQIGLESSPAEYVETLRKVFAEVRRVLRLDGVLWLNIGDSYVGSANSGGENGERFAGDGVHAAGTAVRIAGLPAKRGLPPKNLLGVPWRVAFALQDDGWTLRNAVIWHKPNAMPESVTDRLSTRYEHVFLFTRSRRYWFDLDAIRERHSSLDRIGNRAPNFAPHKWIRGEFSVPNNNRSGGDGVGYDDAGRNPGDVWTIPTAPYPAAHFATFPPELARRCILAGCPQGGTVLDPFTGSGTTLMVARQLLRKSVGVELNPDYCRLAVDRIGQPVFDFGEPA